MKIAIKLCLFSFLFTFFSASITGQTCSDGAYQWSDMVIIFDGYGCNSSGCHGGANALDLTTFAGFTAGGNKCGGELLDGTNFVDIIETGGVSCTDGTISSSMNSRISGSVSAADVAAIQAYIDAGAFQFCRGTPLDDGVCDPPSTIESLPAPAQSTLCNDGSDAPTFTAPTASLPDVQVVIEVNGVLTTISDDGSFDTSILAEGDEVCYTAFTFDLEAINALLTTASQVCPIINCDNSFDLDGVNMAIEDLVDGVNDGVPGLNDLLEALAFAGSFGNPIESVQTAGSTLDALNIEIGDLLGNVCYASSESVCLNVVSCGGPNTCPTVYLNDNNLPNLPNALCVGDLLELCFDIAVDEALFDANSIEFNYELLIGGSVATVALTNNYSSGTAIDANATGQICFSANIPAGISSCESYELSLEIETVFYRDEDCPDDLVAYDLNLTAPLAVVQTGEDLNTLVPLLGIAGLNPILVQVYPAPNWTATVTQAPACDGSTLGVVEISAADGTLCDTVSDLGTAGADGECPANNAELPEYTFTAFETFIVPDQNDMDSIVVNPCAINIVVPAQTINCVEACGPCSGEEVEVTFSVDMSCSGTDARPPVVTGPFNGFSGDGNIMIDPDGDDIWEAVICATPGASFEYKYAIQDFVAQENLVDDAIAGANGNTCDLNTNFFDFSNRLITIPAAGGVLPTDAYGICGTCESPPINITFSVDMSCSDVTPGTQVAMFGGFNGFCCPYNLQDTDGDNVWSTTLPFPADADGCISMQYLYMSPDFDNIETFLTNGEDIANCPNIFSDFNEFANRIIEVCQDTVVDDYWNSCSAPAEPDTGCDDGDCSNGLETWDGCACAAGTPPEVPNCDDNDCSTIDTYDEATCSCTNTADPNLPLDCDDMDCNTDDSYDTATCSCVNTPVTVDPDDGCEFTDDAYDMATCTVTNVSNCAAGTNLDLANCTCTTIVVDGCTDACDPNYNPASTNDDLCAGYDTICDDNDCSTIDAYDDATCSCTNTADPNLPLDCDDMDCNTDDSYDTATCSCINTPVTVDPDDGCEFTDDAYDAATCTVTNVSNCAAGTNLDLANCTCTTIVVDGCTDACDPNYNPASTNDDLCAGYDTICDDDDCSTIDAYDVATCSCTNTADPNLPLDCDDMDCNTDDSYDTATCSCINTPVTVDPDDGCEFTDDAYDAATCTVTNVSNCAAGTNLDLANCTCTTIVVDGCTDVCDPNYNPASTNDDLCAGYDTICDDNDCSTIDGYDVATCSCTNTADSNLPLNCDDGDCSNGEETYNPATCSCDAGTPPSCVFGEQFNTTTCMCEPLPATCDDPCAPNFGEAEACDVYDMTCSSSCTVWDTESCSCMIDPLLDYSCDDNNDCTNDSFDETICECVNEPIAGCGDCVPPTPGTIDCD